MSTAVLMLLLMWGQAPAGRAAAPPPAAQTVADDYMVGPQDVLSLTVFNDDTLSRPALVVDTDGTIDCPYIGRQKVTGMTTRQIEEMLRRLLGLRRDAQGKVVGGYLTNPNINVSVKDFRSQRVNVMGAVRNPGYVELQGDPTLTRALSQAGYPTPESGSYVQITHEDGESSGSTSPEAKQERVPRQEIENGRASRMRLRPGDSVFVPPADKFFISGEVRTVGQLALNQETTVQQAIIMAGGLTDRANKNRVRIRRVVDGKTVDIKAKDSTVVLPGDTITVGRRIF
ncbi:MAG TPA: polysaccharide biosynthesis/export family protein [Vicinamibacterales bacterium]|nr:polysaccharide biosynthesis/export family protein [Vicinamibacterales bacterium]